MRDQRSAILGATVAVLVLACQTAGAPAPASGAGLRALDAIVGSWHCVSRRPGKRDRTFTVSVGYDLQGKWIKYHLEEPMVGKPLVEEGYFTYQATTNTYAVLDRDTTGNYDFETSPGWIGNTIAFTGWISENGKRRWEGDEFSKLGNGQITHRPLVKRNGKPVAVGVDTCTRR